MQVKKQQLEPDMEQLPGSKLGKEYDKAVYCHPDLIYMKYNVCISITESLLYSRNECNVVNQLYFNKIVLITDINSKW